MEIKSEKGNGNENENLSQDFNDFEIKPEMAMENLTQDSKVLKIKPEIVVVWTLAEPLDHFRKHAFDQIFRDWSPFILPVADGLYKDEIK